MNEYVKNLNRMEFVVTYACTGRCKHCSEGSHSSSGICLDGKTAARAVCELAGQFPVTSVMTFGGEPLLCPETVYDIHKAAMEMGIPKRQLITNGFFSRDSTAIKNTTWKLAQAGVNDILLSVDAFHQETIPLEPVKAFAQTVSSYDIRVRVHPAWVGSRREVNPYNIRTAEILVEFERMGFLQSEGNIVVPKGNALKYLGDYYDANQAYADPYEEDPRDIRTVCIDPDGSVLGGSIDRESILEILKRYVPGDMTDTI